MLPWIMHSLNVTMDHAQGTGPAVSQQPFRGTSDCGYHNKVHVYADTNDIQTTGSLVPGAPLPACVACSMKQTKAGGGGLGTRLDYWYLATSIALKT